MRTLLTVALLLCAATAAYGGGSGRERRGLLTFYDLARGNKGAEPAPAMVTTPKPNKKFKGFNIDDALKPANDKGFNIEDALNPANNRFNAPDQGVRDGTCANIREEFMEFREKLEMLFRMSDLQLKLIQELSQRRGK